MKFLLLFFCCNVFSYELGIIAMFKDEALFLREWIEYHRMVGVEHFWLYDDGSLDDWEEILKPYIQEGLVEVHDSVQLPARRERQIATYKEGLRKAVDRSKWVALIDIDEFLLPMQHKTVTECLKDQFFLASEVYVNWRCFGTSGLTVPEGEGLLFHLIEASLEQHPNNWIGKSIVKPKHCLIDEMSSVHKFPLQEGKLFLNGNRLPVQEMGTFNHYGKYIRINHYQLRDESFFHNRRPFLSHADPKILQKHYIDFGQTKDYKMCEFIKQFHPEECKRIWGH